MLRGDDWRAGGQRPPELRPRCLLAVGHGENLQIAAAQRNDPATGAQALMPPAPGSAKPVFNLKPRCARIHVGRRDNDMSIPTAVRSPRAARPQIAATPTRRTIKTLRRTSAPA